MSDSDRLLGLVVTRLHITLKRQAFLTDCIRELPGGAAALARAPFRMDRINLIEEFRQNFGGAEWEGAADLVRVWEQDQGSRDPEAS